MGQQQNFSIQELQAKKDKALSELEEAQDAFDLYQGPNQQQQLAQASAKVNQLDEALAQAEAAAKARVQDEVDAFKRESRQRQAEQLPLPFASGILPYNEKEARRI